MRHALHSPALRGPLLGLALAAGFGVPLWAQTEPPSGAGRPAEAQDGADAAQTEHSLRHRIPKPLVYVCVEPRAAADGAPLVEQLLGHPALRRLAGEDAAGPALAVFRRFLSRSGGGMELALTDIGAAGRPVMLFRGMLADADAKALRETVLRDGGGATVGEGRHPVHVLAAGGNGRRPIEAVLAGRELVVSNDRRALDGLFAEGTRSIESLAGDAGFQRLHAELANEESEITAFVDGARLQRRLAGRHGADRSPLAGLLSWSGMRDGAALVAALRSFDGGVATVALVDRLGGPAGAPRPTEAGKPAESGAAGWLDLMQPVPPRVLARSFPSGGVFSVLLSADPERLAASGVGGGEFAMLRRALSDGCGGLGLSFDNQVLRRLAGTGALRMMMVPGEDGLEPVWSLRARSRSAASDLFDDLRRAVVQAGLGEWERDRGQPERLRLFGDRANAFEGGHPAVFGPTPLFVSTAAESLLFARTGTALDAAEAAARQRGPDLWTAWTDAGFDRNAKDVVGMLLLDVAPLLEAGEQVGFPTRHIGAIRVAHDHVRVEVVSPH